MSVKGSFKKFFQAGKQGYHLAELEAQATAVQMGLETHSPLEKARIMADLGSEISGISGNASRFNAIQRAYFKAARLLVEADLTGQLNAELFAKRDSMAPERYVQGERLLEQKASGFGSFRKAASFIAKQVRAADFSPIPKKQKMKA